MSSHSHNKCYLASHKAEIIYRSTMLLCFLSCFGMIDNVYGTNDAVLSSQELGIPEPLVFDLVRPLNSPKGELEVNALINRSSQTGEFSWAPEIEYAFSDGYAVELELPFEYSKLEEYKVGLQGTFGELLEGRMIHGWQALGRYGRYEKRYSADILYLNGVRLSNKWSTMNMIGLRHTDFSELDNILTLVNNNFFYHYSQSLTVGVELNSEINTRKLWQYRLTPQIHYSMSSGKAIQIGGGPANLDKAVKTDWLVTVRIMQTF